MPESEQEESFDELLGCEQASDEDLETDEVQPPPHVETARATHLAAMLPPQPCLSYHSKQQDIQPV